MGSFREGGSSTVLSTSRGFSDQNLRNHWESRQWLAHDQLSVHSTLGHPDVFPICRTEAQEGCEETYETYETEGYNSIEDRRSIRDSACYLHL